MKRVVHLFAAILALGTGPLGAAQTIRLAPSSKWTVEYADDACRLKRVFGEGDRKTAFMIERFAPGSRFSLVVAGPPFAKMKGGRVTFRFGPARPPLKRFVKLGKLPAFDHAVIVPAMRLDAEEDEGWRDRPDLVEAAPLSAIATNEQRLAKSVSWLSVKPLDHDEIVLELGPMAEPIQSLQDCTSELITHWGIDSARHMTLRRPATPANRPSDWMSNRDYPTHLLRAGMEGLVHFRIMVDGRGKPTACHVQASTRPPEFDEALCTSLSRRMRFEPALDSLGAPLPSYFRSTVRFQIPD